MFQWDVVVFVCPLVLTTCPPLAHHRLAHKRWLWLADGERDPS
ncbi:hypothetical protein ZOSMA_168G00050 [Zostera marina]|uniref:Uncharacterized protein n=1 Tax=Zostera marina TaxID=29655 RepID=A0A0K9PTI9_ZOSMR|nr:hypothetical protein ZOSMA_168G00050 [Zostera marina]